MNTHQGHIPLAVDPQEKSPLEAASAATGAFGLELRPFGGGERRV